MEKFSKLRQILYSSGSAGYSIMDNIFGVYLIFFLLPPKETGLPELISNKPLFLGLTVIGLIIILGRIVDSIADPLIAHWSDNSRSGIGRRKFFLVTGALPFCVLTVLLFFPPYNNVSYLNAIYIAVILGLYFFFYTYYITPYLALIPELSHSHKDRIFITVLQAIFALIGGALILIVVPSIWFSFQEAAISKSNSLKLSIVIMSAIGFILMIIAAMPINEKKHTVSTPANVKLIESIKMTLRNRTFIIYMIPTILYWFAFNIIRAIIAYYPVVLLHVDQSFQTMLMVILFGSAAVCFILITFISKRVSNKTLMLAGLLTFSLFMNLTFIIDFLGDFRIMGACIQMALLGIPVSILLVIPNAIISDISEIDGHTTGKNREAMFFGTQGLFMKVNYGIAAAIVTYLFSTFGKDAANPLGVMLAGPVAGIFSLIGFFIFLLYPSKAINSQLENKRKQE